MRSRLTIFSMLLLGVVGLVSCSSGTQTTSSRSANPSSATRSRRKDEDKDEESTEPTSRAATTTTSKADQHLSPNSAATLHQASWTGGNGCTSPTAADIGTALGSTITKSIPAADNGCLWEVDPTHTVQVSYHPTGSENGINPVMLGVFHNGPGITDISVPGSTQAFIREVPPLGNQENPNAYVAFPEGIVQVAFGAPVGSITQEQMEAVVGVILR